MSWFAALKTDRPVLSVDLQSYSAVLAGAITLRNEALDAEHLITKWINKAVARLHRSHLWLVASQWEDESILLKECAERAQELCSRVSRVGPMWNAYGGHYYSPAQALTLDYLLKYVPTEIAVRSVCLAALIMAASKAAAAPGHTAQPFKANDTAGRFLLESWRKDLVGYVKQSLRELCAFHAHTPGEVKTGDAIAIASELRPTDLVFVDPPYSGVQYSRFYHVLETIAVGKCGDVSGVGRYPPRNERPQSKFSNISESKDELKLLLKNLSLTGATVIFTFPRGKCSNGLSSTIVRQYARRFFLVEDVEAVKSKFSTLGGNDAGSRKARQNSVELILVLRPKPRLNA